MKEKRRPEVEAYAGITVKEKKGGDDGGSPSPSPPRPLPYLLHYYCTSFEKRSTVLEQFFLFPFLGFAIHVQYRPRGVFQFLSFLFFFRRVVRMVGPLGAVRVRGGLVLYLP
jgi:hypothetical protein